MADRYWVGGTSNWDNFAFSRWSATSGGPGGEAVPTSADDVYFDGASGAVTVTIGSNRQAKSINCTGFTGTLGNSSNSITISGSVTLVAGMNFTLTGTIILNGTGTLATAGKTISSLDVNAAGITVTLSDSLTVSGQLNLLQGTFDTANNNVTMANFVSNSGNTRVLTLGSSTLTVSNTGNSWSLVSGGLTINPGNSQIIFTGANVSFSGMSKNYYDVSFTDTSVGTHSIQGLNIFNNISVTGSASVGVRQLTFSSSQTINGTLSTTGTAGNRRVWFRSATYGGGQTLTVNAASLTDADFRDIYVIGAGAPISGTRIGNRGNNRGITFSTPKSVYWNLAGTQDWTANGWAPSSAGTPNTDNYPLPQDTAIFDNAGSAGTVSINTAGTAIGTIDMTGRTSAVTISFGSSVTCHGDWKNGSGTTLSSTGNLSFSGEGTKTITSASKTFSCPIIVDAYNGAVELADALNIGSQTLTVTNGTFDTKNYNVTAGSLSSNNSNFRTITLGSSTVTLSSTAPVVFTTSQNLTFNIGTSTLSLSATSAITFSGNGLTFYNVSFIGTTAAIHLVSGANTFNNLTLTAPATAGLMQCMFDSNQTITGTFTCAGASAVRRIFVRANTAGTAGGTSISVGAFVRTLTVGTISADDCDFRDIIIAGTATGSAPTRAGDCGGNSGITFPAPKTVYWNLSGSQNWSATAWAPGSGGSPDINNFPLAQDTVVFDDAGSAGTVTINANWNFGTFDASARTSAMTLQTSGNVPVAHGSWTFGTGVTPNIGIQFSGRGTSTITSNGKSFGGINVDCVTGTVQLADALTIGGSLGVLSGTIDSVSYNVTMGGGVDSRSNSIRAFKLGSSVWTLGSAAILLRFWYMDTVPGGGALTALTIEPGTSEIIVAFNTPSVSHIWQGGDKAYHKLTLGGDPTLGSGLIFGIAGLSTFDEVSDLKTISHTFGFQGSGAGNTIRKWSISGSATHTVTVTGTVTIAGPAVTGVNYLACSGLTISASSPGEFYAGVNSTGATTAPKFASAAPAGRTLYWVGGTGNWNDTARWSLSSGGAGGEAVPRSMDNVIFDSGSNATGYTATVNQITGGNRCNALTIAGPATGNLTLAGSVELIIHDDITLPATGLTRTYTGAIILSSDQTGRTLTTNGVALASNITINGIDCEWTLADALDCGSSTITVTNGLFDTDTYNITAGSVVSSNSNLRTIDFGSSTVTLSGAAPINFGTSTPDSTNLTFTAGTSQINASNASATFTGNNKTFYNVSFTSASTGTRTIQGINTFNNLSLTASGTGLTLLSVEANQTVSGTFTSAGSSAIARGFVRSNTIGTTRTITAATLSANDCDFRDITIAGVAAGTSPTRAGDCNGNSGITFPAPKTVYWNLAGTQNWNATAWATTNNGTPAVDNFPLAQDTATFTDSGSAGTVQFGSTAYNFSSIDASTRTSAMTLSHNGSQTLYGSYILGSGVTVSGTSGQTFAGRGTMTFTSAGKTITFPITVDAPGGTFQLGDATTTSSTITHARGTFNASNYNLTSTTFSSSNSNVRTITIGSGTWTLTSTGTVWDTSTSTNLTLNANTSTILLSNTTTTARTFTGGGMSFNKLTIGGATGISTLSITGFNSFNEIASTKTVAHTVRFTANQNTIGTWSVTGSSGNVVTVDSSVAGTRRLMRLTNATSAIDYLSVTDIEVNAIDKFYAGANSTNIGNTLNVYFAVAPTPPPPPPSEGNMFLLFM